MRQLVSQTGTVIQWSLQISRDLAAARSGGGGGGPAETQPRMSLLQLEYLSLVGKKSLDTLRNGCWFFCGRSSLGRRELRKMDLKLQKGCCSAKWGEDFSQGMKEKRDSREVLCLLQGWR